METLALERLILNAEAAFEREEYAEALGFLEEALIIEPNHSKAHSHMGWIYIYHMTNLEKAESHLRYALKSEPVFGPAYIHFAHILFEKGVHNEMIEILNKALSHGGVPRSFVFNEFGRISEASGKLRKAIANYKKAITNSFDDNEIKVIKDNIHRCRYKRWILAF